jgi:ATP-binding cassette subfamily B protein RaxB
MQATNIRNLSFLGATRLPIIRQNEAAECGNACLAMVAHFHGFKTDIATLRRRFPTSARGMNLRMLIENASRFGFAARALKSDITELHKIRLPAILHWNLNHFVVLKSINRKSVVVHDPAKGIEKLTLEEFGNHYTGILLELTPTSNFEKKDERVKLKLSSLWSKLTGYGSSITQMLILSVVLQAYVLASPQYLQIVIDTVLPAFDLDLLLILAIGFGLFLIVDTIASVLRSFVMLYAGSSMAYQISINLFSHLIRLPLPFFERRHVGDIVSRMESIDPIKQFLVGGVVLGIVDGIMAVVTLALMFAYSPMLALVSLTALTLYLIIRLAMLPRFRRATEEAIITGATEHTNFIETTRGVMAIKAFAKEDSRQQRWQNLLADTVNQSVRVQRLDIGFETASALIRGLEGVIVIYLAAKMVMNTEFTIGMIFAFTAYRGQFVEKSTTLVELLIQFRMLDLHLDRIADIATSKPEEREGEEIAVTEGKIELRDVGYRYEPHLPAVLQNVNLTIKPGECVALVGPSGSGKTTLLKLMVSLMSPTTGEISIDGTPLNRANPMYYREQIGSVMQDDSLFAGSISEAITFSDLEPDAKRIVQSAQLACIHDDILKMPMGYETPVGDMGSALSGGQVQRVLLARALYCQPRILFIDEGTSSVDIETEQKINNAIGSLGITRVMVAHRPETIRRADRIILITPTGVIEQESEINS